MIYFGEFTNRINNLISVKFDSQSEIKDIWLDNIAYSDKALLNEVKEHYMFNFNIAKNEVTIVPTETKTNLSVIRLFKDCPISITKYAGDQCRVVITNLQKTKAFMPAFFINLNQTFAYTPQEDCYMLVNINTENYIPYIGAKTTRQDAEEIIFSEDPVTISTKSDGIYAPLKLNGATVRIMTNKLLTDLFVIEKQGVRCTIQNKNSGTMLFNGFVAPTLYSQKYNHIYEELEVECVSPFSTLDETEWQEDELRPTKQISWYEVLIDIFNATNVYNEFYVYKHILVDQKSNWLQYVYIHTQSLKDKKLKEILEEFCKTFSLSLCEVNGKVFFIDFDTLSKDLGYIKYNTSNWNVEEYTIPSDTTWITIASNNDTISFDDVYSSINVISNPQIDNETILDLSEENLECIHPNIPYIKIVCEANSSDANALFTSGNRKYKHIDLYRFYRLKNCKHYLYPSNLNFENNTYGFANYRIEDKIIFESSNEEEVRNTIIQRMNVYASCYVVKHFEYKSINEFYYITSENLSPTAINFETMLLFSYGLRNNGIGGVDAGQDEKKENTYYNHISQLKSRPFLETNYNISLFTSKDFRTYLKTKGDVFFMKNYLTMGADRFNTNDLHKFTLNEYQHSKVASNGLQMFQLNAATYSTDLGQTKYQFVGAIDYADREEYYNNSKQLLYKWLPVKRNGDIFELNVINNDGDFKEIENNITDKIALYAPLPYYCFPCLAAGYGVIKNIEISIDKEYPIETVVEGKVDNEEIKTEFGIKGNGNLDIELNYHTQILEREQSTSSLLINRDGVLEYMSNDIIKVGIRQPIKVEEIIGSAYIKHYQIPKYVYTTTYAVSTSGIKRDVVCDKINPTNILQASETEGYLSFGKGDEPFKDFCIDATEYNVLNETKFIKLIEI